MCINVNLSDFDFLFLHKYTWDGSGCVTEYVWGTCVDLSLGYLYPKRTLADVEIIKPANGRVPVYNREFERYSGCLFLEKYTLEDSGGVTECVGGTCTHWKTVLV